MLHATQLIRHAARLLYYVSFFCYRIFYSGEIKIWNMVALSSSDDETCCDILDCLQLENKRLYDAPYINELRCGNSGDTRRTHGPSLLNDCST